MDKYESLITTVVFQPSGTYIHNRQQLCEFTSKEVNSEILLRIGEIITHNGVNFEIKDIAFRMLEEWDSKVNKIDVFTEFDNNPYNCKIIVKIEEIE